MNDFYENGRGKNASSENNIGIWNVKIKVIALVEMATIEN